MYICMTSFSELSPIHVPIYMVFWFWFMFCGFCFGFGFFLLVSVETCSDILKGLQKKSLNTWSLNTYMWRYTLYTWVILLQNLRYLLVRETDLFNQHFMVLVWIWHSINSSPHSIATCNLLITDTRWQTYRRFHTVFE